MTDSEQGTVPNGIVRKLHFGLSFALMIFVVFHLINHAFGLLGPNAHMSFMEKLRVVYRQPVVEAVLIIAVAAQILLGLRLAFSALKYGPSFFGRLQVFSGVYLAAFLLIHVSSVLMGRNVVGPDTNYFFAVAGYRSELAVWFFVPYYFLAVAAIFAHIGCAIYWRFYDKNLTFARRWAYGLLIFGCAYSALLTVSQAGWLMPFDVPDFYIDLYRPSN